MMGLQFWVVAPALLGYHLVQWLGLAVVYKVNLFSLAAFKILGCSAVSLYCVWVYLFSPFSPLSLPAFSLSHLISSFLFFSHILVSGYVCLSSHLWLSSCFWFGLWWIKLLWASVNKPLSGGLFLFFLLLLLMSVCLATICFSKGVALFEIPTRNVQDSQCLILANTWYCQSFPF